MQRWQLGPDTDSASSSRKRPRDDSDSRPALQLTLDSPEEQAAAEAVLASLYLTKEPLKQLRMEQLVQAAVIADRLQIMTAAQQTADLLVAAVRQHAGLPLAPVKALCELGSLPSCLVPVVPALVTSWQMDSKARQNDGHRTNIQRILVAAFGRLNDVWADKKQKDLLLQLPVAGMQLLLSADQLQVDSEDTVLYTAVQYVKAQRHDEKVAAAKRDLPALIRCHYLSKCCLSAVALSTGLSHILHSYKGQLQQLLALRLLSPYRIIRRVRDIIKDAPAAWLLPARSYIKVPTVSVKWGVDMEELCRCSKDCCELKKEQTLGGPATPPKAGLGWKPVLVFTPCGPDEAEVGSCRLGLYVGPDVPPTGAVFRYVVHACVRAEASASAEVLVHQRFSGNTDVLHDEQHGSWDVFGLGQMCGGLDMDAWANKGLPATGQVHFEIVITRVHGEEGPPNDSDFDSESDSDWGW